MKIINLFNLIFLASIIFLNLLGCTSGENTTNKSNNAERGSIDSYRSNIGKTAFNATNGVEIGKIVDVEMTQINGIEYIIYKINNGGRIINAPTSNVIIKDLPLTVAKDPKPIAENAKVDSTLANVASEFRNRLTHYDGQILSLTLNNGRINAEWKSQKCDYLKPEVTDLALSINKGYMDNFNEINIKRTCDSITKKFTISGSKFSQYKSGKIGDSQFLKDIK